MLENQKNLSENLRQNLVLLDLKELLITTLSRHEAMLILLVRTTNSCASYLQLLQRTTALDDLRICLDHTLLMSACCIGRVKKLGLLTASVRINTRRWRCTKKAAKNDKGLYEGKPKAFKILKAFKDARNIQLFNRTV